MTLVTIYKTLLQGRHCKGTDVYSLETKLNLKRQRICKCVYMYHYTGKQKHYPM